MYRAPPMILKRSDEASWNIWCDRKAAGYHRPCKAQRRPRLEPEQYSRGENHDPLASDLGRQLPSREGRRRSVGSARVLVFRFLLVLEGPDPGLNSRQCRGGE